MIDAVMPTYARVDLAFERGEGAYLFTADGRRFLDFASGIAVTALGHGHPHLVEALRRQGEKVWHVSNLFRIPEGERLARRLVEASFADTAFFCNSGVEAIECGIKLVRKYQHAQGSAKRWRIITCGGAFHGRTLTAIAAAGNPKYLEGFGPSAPGFDHVPFNNMNELRNAITDETAGILVEPIQGEGGIRPAELRFLQDLRQVCDEHGLLLYFDEIQCGMGRTGKLFAYEHAGVTPDVIALAKGIGGGFPLGACLASEAAAAGMTPGTHGTTYGGNPLAMAVGNAVLDVLLEDGFLPAVAEQGQRLRQGLDAIVADNPRVFEAVRGAGMMLGLKCHTPNGEVVTALRQEGLLTVPAGENVVRLLPPLIAREAEVDAALDCVGAAARKLSAAAA